MEKAPKISESSFYYFGEKQITKKIICRDKFAQMYARSLLQLPFNGHALTELATQGWNSVVASLNLIEQFFSQK